jgi:hypothetical protein
MATGPAGSRGKCARWRDLAVGGLGVLRWWRSPGKKMEVIVRT